MKKVKLFKKEGDKYKCSICGKEYVLRREAILCCEWQKQFERRDEDEKSS